MPNSDSFFKGLLFGAVVGAVAGLLLAPKKGEETQEELKKVLQQFSERATDAYQDAKKMVNKRVKDLKEAGSKIDQKKYVAIVNEVMEELKNNGEITATGFNKLGNQLKRDWKKVQTSFAD